MNQTDWFYTCGPWMPAGAGTVHSHRAGTQPTMPILRLAASLALSIIASTAFAQDATKGNAEAGKIKAYSCTGCHGVPGYKNVYPHYHVPKIGGQNHEYLVAALKEYQAGTRTHPTMQAQASSFSDQDVADIAAYLSSLRRESAQ